MPIVGILSSRPVPSTYFFIVSGFTTTCKYLDKIVKFKEFITHHKILKLSIAFHRNCVWVTNLEPVILGVLLEPCCLTFPYDKRFEFFVAGRH